MDIVSEVKGLSDFKLYCYCLMNNHVHLLIRVGDESLGTIMKRIGVRYVLWFNGKYERIGTLFQDRYKSESILDDNYLLAALRYILNNPIKAGLVKRLEDYRWSSYGEYVSGISEITDTDGILPLFSTVLTKQKDSFIEFLGEPDVVEFMDWI